MSMHVYACIYAGRHVYMHASHDTDGTVNGAIWLFV